MFTWANALTALRLLCAPLLALCIARQAWMLSALLFTIAALSDFYDGRLARARHQQSAWGGLFDHGTDALLVTLCCWALGSINLINPLLSWFIAAAFVQYMLDSKALAGRSLRTSAIGRGNGVAYFVLVGVAIGGALLELRFVLILVQWSAWVLVLSTAVSMLDRAITLLRR